MVTPRPSLNGETPPPLWEHQREDLEASWNRRACFFHWEPRTGKSRIAIETALRLYGANEIDAAIVVAPSGVHLNWTREQIPNFWPADVEAFLFEWDSDRATSGVKWFYNTAREAMTTKAFAWITINVEAIRPKMKATRFIANVTKRRPCLLIVDESHYVKTPNAARTKKLDELSKGFPFRRCLTGTPVTVGPFDLFSQYRILDRRLFGNTFAPFKARYGQYERRNYNGPEKDPVPALVGYRNLPELRRKIAGLTYVRKKADCIDLPERLFDVERFTLPRELRRLYNQMLEESRILIADDAILAKEVLSRLLRLQQIARGYISNEKGEIRWLVDTPPSVVRARELIRQHAATGRGKAIVWARFRPDLDALEPAFAEELGAKAVLRCDGSTPDDVRVEYRERFREDPDARVWLGTAATGGIGVDLGAADFMLWFSHGYNMAERVQALERNFGSSQKANRIDVVDLVAADTVDERALEIMRTKQKMADTLTPVKFDAETNRGLFNP